MPKLIFEFKTKEELDKWHGIYPDGGGEDVIYDGFREDGEDYPEIKITEEN